ncbi:MAG: oligosaccharide flippase family protein [Candidatus Shapirobacteria bacterium]|nr:oligosaccharide flippase family protein [Candidatus Shapirobacteria bacterium]
MEKRIAKNGLYLILSQVAGRTIGFAYFIFLARSLTVENFGIYAWVLGFVYNFLPVADLGIERYILKNLPRHPDRSGEYFRDLLGLKIALAGITFLLTIALGLVLGLSGEKLVSLLIFSLIFLPNNIIHLTASFQNAREEVITGIAANLFFSTLGALMGAGAVFLGLGVTWLFITYFAALLITALGVIVRAQELDLPLKPRFSPKTIRLVWRECRFFAILVIMGNFYLRIPLITIGQTMGDYWAGIYGSVSKFLEAGILIPQAVSLAVAPTFSRLLIQNKNQLKKIYRQISLGVVLLSLLPLMIFLLAGEFFINLVYGGRYLPAVPALKILGLVLPLLFFNFLAANIIENSKKVKGFTPWAIGHFVLVFLLAIILPGRWGIAGGAASLLIGEIIRLGLNQNFINKILKTSS